jgi:hypothetical protein
MVLPSSCCSTEKGRDVRRMLARVRLRKRLARCARAVNVAAEAATYKAWFVPLRVGGKLFRADGVGRPRNFKFEI